MCTLEKMHGIFNENQNAKFSFGLLAFGLILMAIIYFIPGVGDVDRVLGFGVLVVIACLGVVSSIYAYTFNRTLWELVVLPSPLYVTLFWVIVAIVSTVKIFQTVPVSV